MTTFQLTAPNRRRPRPHRMAALRTTAGGVAYPVTQTDVDEQIVCIGCQTPFALGGYYAERPVAPDVAEIVCLRCAAAAPARLAAAAGPANAAAIVYGQDRNLPDPEGWARATIPVVVVEGMPTGDGRLIPAESLSGHRALPIPLLSLSRTTEGGHLEATVAGRIDHLERVPGPDVMNVDTGQPFPEGTFVWRSNEAYVDPDHADYKLIYYGALSGLSVDLSETTAEFVENADDPEGEPLMQLRSGRIAASTACTIPAFPGAHLVLDPSAPTPAGARPTEALAASALPSLTRMDREAAPVREAGTGKIRGWRLVQSATGPSSSASAPPTAPHTTPGSAAATTSVRPAPGLSPATRAAMDAVRLSREHLAGPPATPSARRAGSTGGAPAAAPTTTRTPTPPANGRSAGTKTPAKTPTAGGSSTPPATTSAPAPTSTGGTSSSSGETRTAAALSAAATSPRTASPSRASGSRSTTATAPAGSGSGSASRATSASAGSPTTPPGSATPPRMSSGTPPISWFRDPGLTEPTPLTVTPEGRVYGHIACWDTAHIGLPGDVRPPRSHSDYAHFHVGSAEVLDDDGAPAIISAGVLTMGTGHADLTAGGQAAAEHYDNTGSIAARVCAGEDEWGIWFSGAVDPDLDEVSRRRFLACGLSGDWRPFAGLPEPELVAALSVPTPGFPIPRARVAAGQPVAIVAAGAIRPKETTMSSPQPPTPPADDAPPATIEPGTPVVLGDSGLSGVVGEVTGDTAIIAVEFPVADLTPADPPEGAELASMRKVVDAMNTKIRTLEAQRVLDRV